MALNVVLAVILAAGGLLAVIAYGRASGRRGSDDLDDRVIQRQKEVIDDLDRQVKRLSGQVLTLNQQVANLQGRNEVLEGLYRFDTVPPAFLEAIEASANAHHARTQALFKEALSENIRIMANAVLDVGRIINEHDIKWDGSERRTAADAIEETS